MNAESDDGDRAAILVVGGVVHALKVGADVDAFLNFPGVVEFQDLLWGIVQLAAGASRGRSTAGR